VLEPGGVSRRAADLPSPEVLWKRIEGVVAAIDASPREELVEAPAPRRADRARRRRELTPAVVRAGLRGGAGLASTIQRSTDTVESSMVTDTLTRLLAYAGHHPDGGLVAERIGALLRDREPVGARGRRSRVTWAVRSDPRYRRVYAVNRVLRRPELEQRAGSGSVRLGSRSMKRLYEYWVFLQVLQVARARFGDPEPPGFSVLARGASPGNQRYEIEPGATVTFPGDVHVAFEPPITSRGDGWMDLEYVPHPDPERYPTQLLATPDVVVFRASPHPWATIIDAKYVTRPRVERAAAECHAKYARMRLRGLPVVRHVLIAHPHPGLHVVWAGYGSVPFVPGEPIPPLPLPLPRLAETPYR
jgi:hypothetical protein